MKVKKVVSDICSWWKSRSTWIKVCILVILALVVYVVVHSGSATEKTVEAVRRTDVVRTVNTNGMVVSSTDLALSFEEAKAITSIKVRVGNTVKKGDTLAIMKNTTERAAYTRARGVYLAAQARYKKVLDGSSNEEIALAQTNLDATRKIQDALVMQARQKLFSDNLVAEGQDGSSANAPVITGVYSGTKEGEYRLTLKNATKTEVSFNGLEKGESTVSESSRPLGALGLSVAFPLTKSDYSLSDRWTVTIPNKNGANYSANLNAYLSAIEARDAAIATREAELNLKRATARPADVDAALADIVIAQAALEAANAALERTILRAPADGTITKMNIRLGQIPQSLATAVVLQDVSNLYIEATVAENYIGQLMVGQNVAIVFDALPGTTYRATLSSVDPVVTAGSSGNYVIKALLLNPENILPGMTAAMTITTGVSNAVLALPARMITEVDGKHFVELITDTRSNKTEEREVQIGLRGDNNLVEIKSGLAEGDRVLWVLNNK